MKRKQILTSFKAELKVKSTQRKYSLLIIKFTKINTSNEITASLWQGNTNEHNNPQDVTVNNFSVSIQPLRF